MPARYRTGGCPGFIPRANLLSTFVAGFSQSQIFMGDSYAIILDPTLSMQCRGQSDATTVSNLDAVPPCRATAGNLLVENGDATTRAARRRRNGASVCQHP